MRLGDRHTLELGRARHVVYDVTDGGDRSFGLDVRLRHEGHSTDQFPRQRTSRTGKRTGLDQVVEGTDRNDDAPAEAQRRDLAPSDELVREGPRDAQRSARSSTDIVKGSDRIVASTYS